ncbi:rhodanese-like domain-containing protein [Kaistella antarctica]|uniref:Sulfurtransferase n=1 Tax=Kaistella antarctica TaxID=266748 RepID=A0A3S4V0S5_9FLAO|nr:rhodanese-like domain-containing protein [Kaistella antarctica]KEY19402.1 sulfurtransferase [Kaistella antarctica]SEW06581.1 Rhodanese-related sulfurtransferase [Kaistella antarctica]VEH97549.1 Thiosulfate sulfurtransferase PspE precursor [Kaistella antarctica]
MSIEEVLKTGNYHLVDVREQMELEMDGEIESALNIPLGEIQDRKEEVMQLEGPKIFFCRSGNRSGKALEFFKSENMSDIYNGGGFADVQKSLESI